MSLKDEIKKRKPRERAPLNGRNVLTVKGKDPNKEYRIVNDDGDRIAMLMERGWVVETDQELRIGDRRVATPGKEGSPVQAHVGGGMKAVVMSIPKDLYQEDQAYKQEYVDDMERAMKSAKSGGAADYGTVSIDKGK